MKTHYRDLAGFSLLSVALLLAVHADAIAGGPLDDAAYLWQMADASNSAGAAGGLKAQGPVTLGVALEGPEREASLARGGDGRTARFDGGYLALANDAELTIDPSQWTVAIRLRDPQGLWRYPILGSYGGDRQVSFALHAVDGASKPMTDRNLGGAEVPTIYSWMFRPGGPRSVAGGNSLLELVWGAQEPNSPRVERVHGRRVANAGSDPLEQDVVSAVMKPCFPVALIGPTDWHDVVIALTGPKLQLWIDGVLVDEEFPIGVTRRRTLPFLIGAGQEQGEVQTGFRGLIDHVAIWNRALSADEIAAVSGGKEHVRRRELAILGDESPTMQYFRPRGHNRKAGDLIPYWDAQTGTFRLFYLILRRNMHSKWDGGHGGLEIWQASTKDLRTWEHHPVTIPITEQWEAWNGTGAVAFNDGMYHWLYPTPDYDGDRGGIQHAVSRDGVHFTKNEPHPFLAGGDCEVFQTDDGLFHMVKVGSPRRANTPPVRDKTLVAWVQLADLDQRGGSVLSIEHPDGAQFDALVFGERTPRRWMPGSDRFQRSPSPAAQNAWPEEKAGPNDVVQVALVYRGRRGTLYRNGEVYATYEIASPLTFPPGSSLLIGLRHTQASRQHGFFHGRVLDARLYGEALSAEQLASLRPDAEAGPRPLAWFDFKDGSTRDRTGNSPDGKLYGAARIENGGLVLGEGDYFKMPGVLETQAHLTSRDLVNWTEQKGSFISSDKRLAICPNVFPFGPWYYYLCSSGVWRSRGPLGPWTEHEPLRLDNLAVPKTAAFGKDRRIYAGFLADGGWGGNSVLRELVQDGEGRLGTRFVPELIPECGEPLPIEATVRLEASSGRRTFELPDIPADFRLEMEIAPEGGDAAFGVGLRATQQDAGCELTADTAAERVVFSKMTDSGGGTTGGPSIEGVRVLQEPFRLDVVVRHDIVDAEIGRFRTITTRYWNPAGDRIRLFVDRGAVVFRNVRIRPLKQVYEPYPGWSVAQKAAAASAKDDELPPLGYHLMHPGGPSAPGDPNAAFCLDGVYHLHYILRHPWQGKTSFSFVHVTSPDMLHWTWHATGLQPSLTGHGMFSGTGFITKEGRPAVIYHGQASGRNQIAIAKDNRLSAWEKPYPVEVRTADGREPDMRHWDPDCFLIGDTYYAISGGQNPPVMKSKDLKHWTYLGDFLKHDMPDVALGEDISCPNFFRLGDRWMLLCISHPLGCRYYLGDWDAEAEQFVPRLHGRMNWRRDGEALDDPVYRDFFAPESVLTPDGRRVMWAWCATLDDKLGDKTIQSLPRELSLGSDGTLRIRPLGELESLRYDPVTVTDVTVTPPTRPAGGAASKRLATLAGDALEIRITVDRAQADRKRFGFKLFADKDHEGLPIYILPETGMLRVGGTEAPFAVADLPPGEDVQLRIFVDKYMVEVFVNDRQALVAADLDWRAADGLQAFSFGAPTTIKKVELWKLRPTNQGFLQAEKDRIWEPKTE